MRYIIVCVSAAVLVFMFYALGMAAAPRTDIGAFETRGMGGDSMSPSLDIKPGNAPGWRRPTKRF